MARSPDRLKLGWPHLAFGSKKRRGDLPYVSARPKSTRGRASHAVPTAAAICLLAADVKTRLPATLERPAYTC